MPFESVLNKRTHGKLLLMNCFTWSFRAVLATYGY